MGTEEGRGGEAERERSAVHTQNIQNIHAHTRVLIEEVLIQNHGEFSASQQETSSPGLHPPYRRAH